MQRRLLLGCLMILCWGIAPAQLFKSKTPEPSIEDWRNFEVEEVSRLTPHTLTVPYASDKDLESLNYKKSPFRISLNGKWRYSVSTSLSGLPNPEDKNYSVSGWAEVDVPNYCIEVNGKLAKTTPIKDAAVIPDNSTLITTFHRDFMAPKTWGSYSAFLSLQAHSAYKIWINKQYVGYAEDSRAISEFDISKFLKVGKSNSITMQVYSPSTASVLEMNYARQVNGITDDVLIVLRKSAHVEDYTIVADYDNALSAGKYAMDISLRNPQKKGRYYVEVELWQPNGNQLEKMGKWVVFDKTNLNTLHFERHITNIKPWTAETPVLYTAVVRLRNEEMQLEETLGTRFGFRTIDIKDGQLQVNGTPITLRGVVYGNDLVDIPAQRKEQRIEEDLKLMKQHNVNAIRTSVYSPVNHHFYELCDEYGFYVFCDANIQPLSSSKKTVATDKQYTDLFTGRTKNMYGSFKNYTSIIAWSLGSGADNGACMEQAYRSLKQLDKTRPVFYAGAGYADNTDLVAAKEIGVDDLKAMIVKPQVRPIIFASYGDQRGNNFGGMEPVWGMVRSNRQLQGGFANIWSDVTDYSYPILCKDATAVGFVSSSGKLIPAADELRSIYRPFEVSLISLSSDHGEFAVSNLLDFLPLKDYVLQYNIFSNLKPRIIEGEVDVNLQPGEKKNFKLKIPKLTLYAGEELYIRFTTKQRTETSAIEKGTVLNTVEFPIPMKEVAKENIPEYGREYLNMEQVSDSMSRSVISQVHVYNSAIDLVYDLNAADITEYRLGDEAFLSAAPRMNFTRIPTDNDLVDKNGYRLWKNITSDNMERVVVATHHRRIDSYTIGFDAMLRYVDRAGNTLFDVKQTIAVLHTGDIIIDNEVISSEYVKALPRVGMQLQLALSFDSVRWYGLDRESYVDRNLSGNIGTFCASPLSMFYCYARPQEAGNRMMSHWVAFENKRTGLFVDMIDDVFSFNMYPYSDKQLYTIKRCEDLKQQQYYTVNLDYCHQGVGSATAGLNVQDNALIQPRKHHFRVHMRGYSLEDYVPQDFRRVNYPVVESSVLPMPTIIASKDRFDGPMNITLRTDVKGSEVRYTVDGTVPSQRSSLYTKPFIIQGSTLVKARVFKQGATTSFTATQRFNFDYVVSVKYAKQPNTPYNYNAESILFDGEFAEISDLSRGWLGFSGSDLDATFTLSKSITLQNVEVRFAHVPEAWTFAPVAVDVYTSEDGEHYYGPIEAKIKYDATDIAMNSPQRIDISVDVERTDVRFVRVVARSMGKIPAWHKAKGLRPWIMVDEVRINEQIK